MKKVLLAVFAVFLFCTTNAQEHLSFKGIEITGNVDTFAAQLIKQGYTIKNTLDTGTIILTGQFAGVDSEVFLISTVDNIIWKVLVYFDKKYNRWTSIKSDYNEWKDVLVQKYGKPKSDYHFFSSPYYEGDGYEISALKNDKCTYCAFWNISNGSICVQMSKFCQICIIYEDEIGANLKENASKSAAMNDL